ncbi:MAG: hypothetical protein KDA69_08530 [Planctomycetaceae bacterium]|nr:hypothetical protein [Planctomycetaceae bacterium]MCA9044352.1 hypothetical protein [Planctomycetaceae bacterium]
METHPVKNANRQLVTCLSACILLTMFLVPLVGCRESDDAEYALGEIDSTYDAEWNERNAEIYRYLFSQLEEPPSDRIYFITTTPMAQWTDSGGWDVIPAEELAQFPAASKYRPADEAFMKGSDVLVKGTNAEAWMHWISVKRWVSDTEVEVEKGAWCCNLGGGAAVVIYEKVDGKWHIKKLGPGWVS